VGERARLTPDFHTVTSEVLLFQMTQTKMKMNTFHKQEEDHRPKELSQEVTTLEELAMGLYQVT
jgi:hypothetical protein